MTPEQIQNWRKVLSGMIGPYARIMPEKDIEAMRDGIQTRIEEEFPEHPFEVGDTVKVKYKKGKGYVKEVHGRDVIVKWAWGGAARVSADSLELYEKE